MDFDKPFAEPDDYNKSLRRDLKIREKTLALVQPTRVVRRKGIETAIQLVQELNDKNIKLIITGSHADDDLGRYFSDLMELIHKLNLSRQVYFASERIRNVRYRTPDGHKVYNLSDIYAYARACTYFSTYEGFGNAFVETVLAKRPIFVNNYLPVYWPDIGSKGFKTVMLEGNNLTAEAVEQIKEILYDENLSREIGEHNFALGKKHFSYDVLREKLSDLFVL
jgi:glycosyltransferase involved in cell wall biosynthesis